MSVFWRRALIPPFIILLAALLLWAAASALVAASFLALAFLVRVLLHLRRLAQLDKWLEDPEGYPVPESEGVWGEVFVRLNKMVRQQRKERQQRIEALQDMEQATAALPEGVVILGADDDIEWCNPLAEQHFGLDARRDIGQQITYLARQPEFVRYLNLEDFSEPLILRGTRQDDLVLSIKLVAYGDNKKLLISRDITHLERIETMRRDFVANVSHELRTPLTVVNGFVETLHDMPDIENQMVRRALQLMGEQTYRMEHLVNDLLTLSRLEDTLNTLQEDTVDIPAMVRSLYQEGKSLSAGKHTIHVEVECRDGVTGSADELRSAFGNLVSNAVRYSPEGGEVTLYWKERNGEQVFSVQDTGLGIAPQHIPRLTERFYRIDRSRSRETGGTGLGLAIVKHVLNRHQAHLEIVSEEGNGSTFSIVFPARRRAALADQDAA